MKMYEWIKSTNFYEWVKIRTGIPDSSSATEQNRIIFFMHYKKKKKNGDFPYILYICNAYSDNNKCFLNMSLEFTFQ